ncbi:MAG TPA: HAD family phosphatase [Ktedonobacterales bacterium]|nr:HAD family phosphatase [Ktedonobacterales bacterium]
MSDPREMPQSETNVTDGATSEPTSAARGVVIRNGYAALWDVDGVIIDSAEQHRQSWEALAREQGLPYSDEAFWAGFGMRNSDSIALMFGVRDPERVAALGARKEAIYRDLLRREATALPGARELLAQLHAAGYRQALGSSAPVANIETIIRLLDIGPSLDGFVSGEHVAHGKPAPDIFLACAALVGATPERCVVFEDAPAGVAAARAGGMRCIGVRRAGQPDAPGLEAADRVVDSLRDLTVSDIDHLLGPSAE